MLKNSIKYFIIAMISCSCLVALLPNLKSWHAVITQHQPLFYFWHGLFYLLLYISWPYFVQWYANAQKDITHQQIHFALKARYYLLGSLLFFELLRVWG